MSPCTASLLSILMVLRPPNVGKSFLRQVSQIMFPDLRSPDDLQLHPNQCLPGLPSALSVPVSGWLEGEGHARSHAVWTSVRNCFKRFFPPRGFCGNTVSGVVELSRSSSRFALFE